MFNDNDQDAKNRAIKEFFERMEEQATAPDNTLGAGLNTYPPGSFSWSRSYIKNPETGQWEEKK